MSSMSTSTGPSEDKFSSIDCIESGDSLEIEENKQMVVYRRFKNHGTVRNAGTLVVRC